MPVGAIIRGEQRYSSTHSYSGKQMEHINSDTLHTVSPPNTTCPDGTVYSRSTKFSPINPVTTVLPSLLLPSIPAHTVCLPNHIPSTLPSQHITLYRRTNTSCTFIHLLFKRLTHKNGFSILSNATAYQPLPTTKGTPPSNFKPLPINRPHFPNSQAQTGRTASVHYAHD